MPRAAVRLPRRLGLGARPEAPRAAISFASPSLSTTLPRSVGPTSTLRAAPPRGPPRPRPASWSTAPRALEAALDRPDRISEELGGLPTHRHAADLAADALHRGLAALAWSGEPIARGCARDRVLVALSGGVDSAVAPLLERESGADVVAVTLELGPIGHDGERAAACRRRSSGARVAHGRSGATPDSGPRAASGPRSWSPSSTATRRGGLPTPGRCNGPLRIDAMIELADRLGAPPW